MKRLVFSSPFNLVLIATFLVIFFFRMWEAPTHVLSWDVFGYYLYLPAQFIYHDLALSDISWVKTLQENYEVSTTLYQLVSSPLKNGMVIKYSSGIALLTLPFFLIGHLVAALSGYATDGLSLPYQYAMAFGGLFYIFLGLNYFKKILQHFFEEKIALIVFLVSVFGTNYFHLMTFDGTLLTHNFAFTGLAILVWNTIHWHRHTHWKHAVGIGVSIGIITLVRPTEAVAVLIPVFWNVYDRASFQRKVMLMIEKLSQILLALALATICFLPQIIYWHEVTGQWFFYSYQNAGEGLDFLSPHVLPFLFSFRKGWLIYTPIVFMAFAGFFFLYRQKKELLFSIFLFVVLSVYISASWTCWWYAGGSFSSRTLVPVYVVLALPLGYLLQSIQGKLLKIVVTVFMVGMVLLNLFQSWQFENGVIDKERMTKRYYAAIFGKTERPENAEKLLLIDRTIKDFRVFDSLYTVRGETVFSDPFVSDGRKNKNYEVFNGKTVLKLDKDRKFGSNFQQQFSALTDTDWAWIVIKANVFFPAEYQGQAPLIVGQMMHKGDTYNYRTAPKDKSSIKLGAWNELRLDYLTPHVRTKDDVFKSYLWQRSQSPVYFDELTVEVFTLEQ